MSEIVAPAPATSLSRSIVDAGVMTKDELLSMPLGMRIMFVPELEERFKRTAVAMSNDEFTRPHLKGKPDACYRIIRMALNWGMDPERVASATYSPAPGEIGIEGKLAAAAMIGSRKVHSFKHFHGPNPEDWQRVSGKFKNVPATWPDGNPKKKKNGDPILKQEATYTREDEEGLYLVSTAVMMDGTEVETPKIFLAGCHPRNSMLWNTNPAAQIINVGVRQLFNMATPDISMGVHVDVGLQREFDAPPPVMREINPDPVDLKEAGVTGAGETEPGTTAGVVDGEVMGTKPADASIQDQVQPASTNKATRKRVKVTFRNKVLYKTKFLTSAKQALNSVDEEEEFDRLCIELKAAWESVEDPDQAQAIRDDLQPLIEAVQKDFEEGEEIPNDGEVIPSDDITAPLDQLADDFDLAAE